jgi:hypothetical protein
LQGAAHQAIASQHINTHASRIMRNNLKHFRNVITMVGIVVGLAIAPGSGAFADDDGQADIVSPEENVLGLSYGDWSAAWWQYVLSVPAGINPVLDTTGASCDVEQSASPVFFLAGAATTEPVTRTCTIPAGKALFFPIINVECSTVEPPPFFGSNPQELRECAARLINGVDADTLTVLVDGKEVQDLGDFRAQSPFFDFILPPDNFLGLAGVTSGSAVSDGFWLMLKPLSPGNHVIHFEGAFVSGPGAGFSQNVTYNLTVKG